ncbi:IS66 family transposase, partial [Burkholderia pseudomallei]|uniref:IS66 family transposase n=1 Tax=Burkholderia pseudomallei TaxID=28450 RepID=UPI003984485A
MHVLRSHRTSCSAEPPHRARPGWSGLAGSCVGLEVRGPSERQAYRQTHSRPLLDQLHAWLSTTLETLSRKSDMSRAILYALNRWEALTRYCD